MATSRQQNDGVWEVKIGGNDVKVEVLLSQREADLLLQAEAATEKDDATLGGAVISALVGFASSTARP